MNNITIIEFNFDEKKYKAYIEDNKLKFGVVTNTKIDNNLTQQEKNIISSIYNYVVTENIYYKKAFTLHLDGKDIQAFYNNENKLFSFYEIFSENFFHINKKTLHKLNLIFNNRQTYFAMNEHKKEDDKFKIIVKIGTNIIIVLVTSFITLSSLPTFVPENKTIFNLDYFLDSLYKETDKLEKNPANSFKKIKDAINSNKNFTEEEKKFIIQILENEINENLNYINIKQATKNLKDAKIIYHEQNPDSEVLGTTIIAGKNRNNINLYHHANFSSKDFKTCDKSVLMHEINHLLNKRSFLQTLPSSLGEGANLINLISGIPKSTALEEMTNELFSREYFSEYNNKPSLDGYEKIMPIMYSLCEIIDINVLKKYKFDSDYYYITSYLDSIGVEPYYSKELYKCLELANLDNEIISFDEQQLNNHQLYNLIKYIYEKKYGVAMETDLVMMSYFYNTVYVDEEFNQKYRNYLNVENVEQIVPKAYISKKYQNKQPNITVKIDNINSIEITNDNRFVEEYEFSKTK